MEKEIRKLIDFLNYHTKLYDEGTPIISDKEWDDKYFKLLHLEEASNIRYSDSPTQRIVYSSVSRLKKVKHNHSMLSLDKTKDINDIIKFLGEQPTIAMCKMDGLTCSLRYINGRLYSAETRGNGIEGEDVLHNALVIKNIPKKIPYKEELIVDGEIICDYTSFGEFKEEYKNPRNFAAGSMRLLNARDCEKRRLSFIAWDVIKGLSYLTYLNLKLIKLEDFGFSIVPHILCKNPNEAVQKIKEKAKEKGYPIDGVVFKFNDTEYGKTLGETAHHKRDAMAYKFYDEEYTSSLKDIEWSLGRTGILSPIAIFEPIDIDGTTIERASLHNITIMKTLWDKPWRKGLTVTVFKANAIIPQISKVEDNGIDNTSIELNIPDTCPVCHKKTVIKKTTGEVLWCTNPNCVGKLVNQLDYFCSSKGMNIRGLSETTIGKLIDWGWLGNVEEIYSLSNFKEEWVKKPGFGEKSVSNILQAIEASKTTTMTNFIAALGIPLIGKVAAQQLEDIFNDYWSFREAIKRKYDFTEIENFGECLNAAIYHYDYSFADRIAKFINFKKDEKPVGNEINLTKINFVITGKLKHFKNRDILKSLIEANGGKVLSSVTKSTSYLINNDKESNSSKNLTAQKLQIPIITEDEFLQLFPLI